MVIHAANYIIPAKIIILLIWCRGFNFIHSSKFIALYAGTENRFIEKPSLILKPKGNTGDYYGLRSYEVREIFEKWRMPCPKFGGTLNKYFDNASYHSSHTQYDIFCIFNRYNSTEIGFTYTIILISKTSKLKSARTLRSTPLINCWRKWCTWSWLNISKKIKY